MFVSDRMTKNIITAHPETTLGVARQLMLDHNIRHLPIVDEDGKLLGIISDRDMRTALPSCLLSKEEYAATLVKVMDRPLQDIMTRNPLTIYAYFTIQDTLLVMQKRKVGALPVIDERGYLKGILSTRDLLRAFVNIMNIDEPGTLLCIVVEEQKGQMKKIVDIVTEENISLGSVLVARFWDKSKRAIFPYLLTNNVINVKRKLVDAGFELIDPMKWYFDQIPHTDDLIKGK